MYPTDRVPAVNPLHRPLPQGAVPVASTDTSSSSTSTSSDTSSSSTSTATATSTARPVSVDVLPCGAYVITSPTQRHICTLKWRASRAALLAHRSGLDRARSESDAAGRAYILRHGVPVSAVDIDGPAVVKRNCAAPYDTRPVPSLRGRLYPVKSTSRRYPLRGERPFVTHREVAPSPSRGYASATRDGSRVIVKSIRSYEVPDIVWAAYHQILTSFPRVLLGPGVFGVGLFAGEDIFQDQYVLEYTGNRVGGNRCRVMHRALDRLHCSPDVMENVHSERVTIDPRGCGNHAMTINHSCEPNAQFLETTVGSKTILLIQAARPIRAGQEIVMDYGYNSLHSDPILICECGSKKCRPAI